MDAPRIPRIEAWLVPAAALLLAALFCRPLAVDPDNWGISDWDQHLFFHAVPRRTILHYGEMPLWNPYNSGGLPDLGNPQSRILSPTFPLVLAFGVIHGVKIDIALHCAAAFVFTWLLARKLGSSRAASALAAGVYAFGGLAVYPVAFGMTWSLTIAYVPLLFLGFWRAVEDLRWAWLGGLALALILFGGGAYVLVIAGVFLGIVAALAAIQARSARPLAALALLTLLGLGFAAVKLLPSLAFMRAHPRRMEDQSGYSAAGLLFSLFARHQGASGREAYLQDQGVWRGMVYGYDENFMYIGVVAGILAMAGIAADARRRWPWAVALLLGVWLCFGNRIPVSLWSAIHELPVLSSMRVAQRFRIGVVLFLALFAGFGLDALVRLLAHGGAARFARPIALTIVGVVLADLLWVNGGIWSWAFPIPPIPTYGGRDFRQMLGAPNYDDGGILDGSRPPNPRTISATGLLPAFVSNVGILEANESAMECLDPAQRFEQVIPSFDPNYRGEAYLDGAPGEAVIDRWSPNRVTIRVDAKEAGHLVLNQNYDAGWRAADGRPVERHIPTMLRDRVSGGGVVAVAVTPADRSIELVYDPPAFRWGLGVSAATALIAAILALRGGRPRREG